MFTLRKALAAFVALVVLLLGSVWPALATPPAQDPPPTPTAIAPEEPSEWITTTVEITIAPEKPPRPPKGNPKLGSSLNQLLEVYRQEGLGGAQTFATSRDMFLRDDRVQVVIVTTEEALSEVREEVEAVGGEYQLHYQNLLQALVPIGELEALAGRPDVQIIREPRRAIPLAPMQVGSQTTEGVAASGASSWHAAGYNGTGVRVAVIDAGFTGYSGLLGTDLPSSVTTYDWTGTGLGGTYHGTACAEVVHDMAPGATMYLHKIDTDVELGNAVNKAIADGVNVISMSLGWFPDGPGDGTGNLANIVNNARSNGIFYATAAGNEAEVSWHGTYTDSDGNDAHEWSASGQEINIFGPGHGFAYVVPAGYPIVCGLHWDDWTAVNQDYDLELYSWTGSLWSWVAGSYNDQAGTYPTPEEFIYVNAPYSAPYGVVVRKRSATRNVCLRLICPTMGGLDRRVSARSLTFPADSPNAITVGAVNVSSPYTLEPYSSRGPTFGSGGVCSGGSTKPDIASYANVSTVSYGAGSFSGTSAATPHVAGAAALVKHAYPSYTVSQLQSFLESRAIDMGTAGKDNLYGSGRLHLGSPPSGPPTGYKVYLPLILKNYSVAACGLVPNGDFEQGPVIWTEYSTHGWDLIVTDFPGSVTPHSGSWAVWLGGDFDEISYVQQQVTVPSDCPYLAYWHWIASEDDCGYDFGNVIINGSTVVDEYTLCSSTNTGGWVKHVVNLSSYAGQSVSLQIRAETDDLLDSNLLVDDVAFQASASAAQEGPPVFDPEDAMPKSGEIPPQGVEREKEKGVRVPGQLFR